MKKVLLTVAALLALSMAFVGCNNNTKDESGTETTKATGTYTINELSIAKNYTWSQEGTQDETTFSNWQVIVNLDSSWKLAVEDELTVTFSGKSSKAFKVAKANIVDNTEAAGWWKPLAEVASKDVVIAGSAADDAVATDTFTEVKSTYKIDTAATAAGAAKLVIFIDPVSLGYTDASDAYTNGPATIDFADVTIKVDLNGGSSSSETPAETPTETSKTIDFSKATITEDYNDPKRISVDDDGVLTITADSWDSFTIAFDAMDLSSCTKMTITAKVDADFTAPDAFIFEVSDGTNASGMDSWTDSTLTFGTDYTDWSTDLSKLKFEDTNSKISAAAALDSFAAITKININPRGAKGNIYIKSIKFE